MHTEGQYIDIGTCKILVSIHTDFCTLLAETFKYYPDLEF